MTDLPSLFSGIGDGISGNPLASTMLGLWGAATLTFITKDVPSRVVKFLTGTLTTTLAVSIPTRELVSLTVWLSSRKLAKPSRAFHFNEQSLTLDGGTSFFIYQGRFCWIKKTEEHRDGVRATRDDKKKIEIQLAYLGRDKDFLLSLIRECTKWNPQEETTAIFSPEWRGWRLITTQPKKRMNQLSLPLTTTHSIRQHLDWFFQSETWYRDRGIPYRTGFCFYGPPGTGKTSLVRAVAAEWDLAIYALDLTNLDDAELKQLVWQVGPRALVLIEDIDTIPLDDRRNDGAPEDGKRRTKVTLGGLLNAIDGVVDSHGRVFVMTTNQIEKIDPALLRPGRVNISLKLDFMTPDVLRASFAQYFPNHPVASSTVWRGDISPAHFQSLVLGNTIGPASVLSEVTSGERTMKPSWKRP